MGFAIRGLGLKKLARLGARLVCLDETGFLMTPVIRRTWSLRGLTPTLPLRSRSHEKVSGLGALVVSPRRRRITLYLALCPKENIRGPHVLRFLRHLTRHHRGPRVLLWDLGRPHRHRRVQHYLEASSHWHPEWLPPYAPELNPVEQVWTYLKYGRLSNFAPNEVQEIQREVQKEARRLMRHPDLLKSFFRHSALPFHV
ncbi:MAG: transposase [Candidatus Binatia bacterium]